MILHLKLFLIILTANTNGYRKGYGSMKVLITGGTGTISSGLVEEAVNRGYETYAITRGEHSFRNVEGATYIKADVWDEKSIKQVLENMMFDVIVECLVYDCNQLKKSLSNFGDFCGQYIFISTSGIYNRNSGKGTRISEFDEKNLNSWDYAREKIECEKYLKDYFVDKKTKYTIIRPVVTYGNYRIPFPVVSRINQYTLLERMVVGAPVLACDNVRCAIIHIKDFSKAVVSLFNNPSAFNEDFHISESGQEPFWDDVINASGEIMGVSPKIIHVPLEMFKICFPAIYDELKWNKTTDLLMDDSKIKSVVSDFKQEVSLNEGMSTTIKALKNEYGNYNKTLDNVFWRDCDLVIKYAYKKKKIADEGERAVAKVYISSWTLKKRISINMKMAKRVLRRVLVILGMKR